MFRNLLLVFLLYAYGLSAAAQTIQGEPYVAVHGSAKREVDADTYPTTVTVSETSVDVPAASRLVESLFVKAVEAAQKAGANPSQISALALSIERQNKWDSDSDTWLFLGNRVERQLTVKFAGVAGLQSFLASIPTGEHVAVSLGQPDRSDKSTIESELLVEAANNARQLAENLAASVGGKAGNAFSVSTKALGFNYSGGLGLSPPPPPVVFDEPTLSAVEFALKETKVTVRQDIYIVYRLVD